MKGLKGVGYPAIVLLVGVIAAVVWVIVLDYVYRLSTIGLVQALTSGMLGAAGGSLGALILMLVAKPDQRELDQVAHDARHDALTGLPNRAELFRVLDHSIVEAKWADMVLGVLFLDLDRFKIVNDSMGHEVGDEVLRIVADRLRSTIRSIDVVARLGGDEFVVLCRDLMSSDSVVAMAEQILKGFKEPVAINGQDFRIGTSIGISIATPGQSRLADDLMRDADAAMYRAKETKSGYAVFDDEQRLQVMDRMDIERDLQVAFDRQELVVYYQPIVDVNARALYGFEALVRWNHPTKGLLGPGAFIRVAEEAGLMGRLGEFVLREACAQAAVWNHISPAAHGVKMSVNLAEQQLVDTGLPRRVAEVLSWAGLQPEQLVLEITEDVIVDHLGGLDTLRELRALGIELSIDDFGTGQSSLGYVKQFDMVTTLKIDQRFVRDMRSGEADRAIIEAVLAMATALNMRVVAEGVEYEDQLKELQRLGVGLMQGYLFNSPVGADLIDPTIWFPPPSTDPSQLGSDAVGQGFVRSSARAAESRR
ncbi:MAG: putative bifunctional diguanylate cyclase/phosphodiesterase [Acidimicrobiales bacterium]